MPEVCEVCLTSLYLNKKILNKQLISITILGGRYLRHELPGLNIINKILPTTFTNIDSKGKFMWFQLTNKNNKDKLTTSVYLLNTLGLEGKWGFVKENNSNIAFTIKDKEGKIYTLYFSDSRNFGTLKFTSNVQDLDNKLDTIGDDFLKTSFTNIQFYNRIKKYLKISKKRYDVPIIKVLMDQSIKSGLGSGLGNYLAPEILYRAKISPHTKIGRLFNDKQKVYMLAKYIRYVVKLCYLTNKTEYVKHFEKFINKHRNTSTNYHPTIKIENNVFNYLVYRQKLDPNGNQVLGENIIKGRTTYWVPAVQV